MSSQLISNMTNQDLKFESLLYLASILQACQRLQIRGQAEAFMATRPTSNKTKHDLEFEWLLCLSSALQACQQPQALEVGVHCDSGDSRITNTEKLFGRGSTKGQIHWRSPSAILRFSLATLRRTIHSDTRTSRDLARKTGACQTAGTSRLNPAISTGLGDPAMQTAASSSASEYIEGPGAAFRAC